MSWKSRALAAEAELRGERTERLKEVLFKAQDEWRRTSNFGGLAQQRAEREEIRARAELRKHLDIPGSALWQAPNRAWPQINDWS
jgi:hypothetical protein